ncbi:helix-turn-helix transcriptional regulator [Streptomyces sp. NBC_01264]|uniref:helix-turn-helix transcriptional regulator n=1 Tax=Streptomyces sp. NBC_01264 TaxID=2903804 RepID=UPI002252EAAB|nr:response regulator transcription factor [Streptomyces sp. NBC_01264]MCX4781766.1 response regulator transcription factor [Streptomyces sp. NBC_01264]
MPNRISVFVHALDSISELGVIAALRLRPEVHIVERQDADPDTVAVLVVDEIDDAAVSLVKSTRGQGIQRIVLVASSLEDNGVFAAAEAGISGLARRKDVTADGLVQVITSVNRGAGVLPPDLVGSLLKQVSKLQHQASVPRGGQRYSGITDREADVLRLVSQGLDTNEIAQELCYSERTVKNTLHAINNRFNLRNRPHAVAYAIREGLI